MEKTKQDSERKRKRKFSWSSSVNVGSGQEDVVLKLKKSQQTSPLSNPGINTNEDKVKPETKKGPAAASPKILNESYLKIKARQKAAMNRPKLFLTMDKFKKGENSTKDSDNEKSVFTVDLQCLIIYCLRQGKRCDMPSWCRLIRSGKVSSTVLIVLNDVSFSDFHQHTDCFPFLSKTFSEDLRVKMVSPCKYFSSFDFDMYAVPQSVGLVKGFTRNHGGSFERNERKVLFTFPVTHANESMASSAKLGTHCGERDSEIGPENCCSRMQLLLSVDQMKDERYCLPADEDDASHSASSDFVFSKKKYAPVGPDSPIFAVDCEMCLTTSKINELTRVSITNEQNMVIYDKLVKPHNPISDYLTRFSGITKKMLDSVTTQLEDVQREISDLLPPDAILCGQSLCHDLIALKMFHPYVIDTSYIYNLSGNRRVKCSLKRLAWHFLGRVIQNSTSGHCSAEDALATMDLVKLKLRQSLEFGDAVMGEVDIPYMQVADRATRNDAKGNNSSADSNHNKQDSFQASAKMIVRSLFDFLNYHHLSASLIGRENLVSKYQHEPRLYCKATDSDKKACNAAAKASRETALTWVEFSAFADLLLESKNGQCNGQTEPDVKEKKKVLLKMDKRVEKLIRNLTEKFLVAVVLPGRNSEEQHLNAAIFLHIT